MKEWRIGRNVPINVYDGDRPVCQCHTVADARRIVGAVNYFLGLNEAITAHPEAPAPSRKVSPNKKESV